MDDLGKRITYKRKRPNPLFQEWLEELHVEAKEKGSKLEPMLQEALESLSKYPLPLNSGAECAILRGFHKKLCIFLDRRLHVYKNNLHQEKEDDCFQSQTSDESSQEDLNSKATDDFKKIEFEPLKIDTDPASSNTNTSSALSPCSFAIESFINEYKQNLSKRKYDEFQAPQLYPEKVSSNNNLNLESNNNSEKKYKPLHRSGGYAILIALLEHETQNNGLPLLTKEKLIEKAQPYSEESFTKPTPNSYYTAWSNMTRLLAKGLINKINKKKTYYSLSKEGMTLANELQKEYASIPSMNDIIFNNVSSNSQTILSSEIPVKESDNSKTNTTSTETTSITTFSKRMITETIDLSENLNKQPAIENNYPGSTITVKPIDSLIREEFKSNTPSVPSTSSDTMNNISTVTNVENKSDDLLNNNKPDSFSRNLYDNLFNVPSLPSNATQSNSPPFNPITLNSPDEANEIKTIEFSKGSFDIMLLIDKNETSGSSKKNDPTVTQFQKFPDLKHEYRSLKVGDFLWIAKHRISKEELVLPYIVERKRMDDLGASIKDGRFHEQKFRLRKCGLPHVTYLIESFGKNKNVGLPLQSLKQAITNTKVQDGFKIYMTASLTHSVRFLAMMTKRLTLEFEDQILTGWNNEPSDGKFTTFEYFSKSSVKSKKLTVRETFIKMLVQLKGMSLEKALSITTKYNTPRSLIEAYKYSKVDGRNLLANLKYGELNRNIGPTISKCVYDLFSDLPLE